MFNILRDSAIRVLKDAQRDIRQRMEDEDINASGRTSEALQVEVEGSVVRLVIKAGDVAPISTLEVGRGGGSVPRGFYGIILQWSRVKGISFGSERERRTFAYFVSRKIAREGTGRNKQNVDVYSTIVTKAADELRKSMTTEVTRYIHSNLIGVTNGNN